MSTNQLSLIKKRLIPTFGCAAGMLLGGVICPLFGVLLESESLVVFGYIAGAVLGAIGGSLLGIKYSQ